MVTEINLYYIINCISVTLATPGLGVAMVTEIKLHIFVCVELIFMIWFITTINCQGVSGPWPYQSIYVLGSLLLHKTTICAPSVHITIYVVTTIPLWVKRAHCVRQVKAHGW